MRHLTLGVGFAGLLLAGGVFGFFYAWVCSTMWGLDAADPRVAMAAMQAMNASVRNAVFAPAFFGTGPVLLVAGALAMLVHNRQAAVWFALAGTLYIFGGMILTMAVNVPMNEALGATVVPDDVEAAREIWMAYSETWQVYNQIRTVVSGLTLLAAGIGIFQLARST